LAQHEIRPGGRHVFYLFLDQLFGNLANAAVSFFGHAL